VAKFAKFTMVDGRHFENESFTVSEL